jgi:hypothetical protein
VAKLTIFHYHLLTGGITKVITSALRALLTEGSQPHEITVVCGREENSREVISAVQAELSPEPAGRLQVDILPEIDYISKMTSPPDPDRTAELLLSRYSGTVWWIHNYHIGKNPAFTAALLRVAAEHPQQKMVFHIHDFPESGRLSNLSALNETVGRSFYPVSPNVRYAVINSRDKRILSDAGIPEELLFLLNNPVSAEAPPEADAGRKEQLRAWAAETAPRWEEEGELFLYPVRTIRRKNVLEAALAVKLLRRPANLLVTLPGTSDREQPYSDLVQRCFEDGLVPGGWAIGTRLEEGGFSFPELLASADRIISSSIQEGFGYLFIDAVRQRLPLLARDLDILEGIRPLFSGYPARFYRQLTVPLESADSTELGILYRDALEKMRGVLSASRIESLQYEVHELLTAGEIDFSYLSVDMQRRILEQSDDPAFLETLRDLNPDLAAEEAVRKSPEIPEKRAEIDRLFGPASHAAGMEKIIDSLEHPTGEAVAAGIRETRAETIHQRVLARFSSLDYMRLLYFQ